MLLARLLRQYALTLCWLFVVLGVFGTYILAFPTPDTLESDYYSLIYNELNHGSRSDSSKPNVLGDIVGRTHLKHHLIVISAYKSEYSAASAAPTAVAPDSLQFWIVNKRDYKVHGPFNYEAFGRHGQTMAIEGRITVCTDLY